MISINWSIMLWVIFAMWIIKVPTSIILGIAKDGEPKKYGVGDTLDGIITFIIILWMILG